MNRYRSCWISDLHLGTRGASAEAVLEFLRATECERLYVVGDLIDVWRLRRARYWPQSHNDVVQELLRKSRKGTDIYYVPGNHDDFCLNFLGTFGNISVLENTVHETADGRRLLILHGHEFDVVTLNHRWLAHFGDIGYSILLRVNKELNFVRRVLGLGYWSLSQWIKAKVKNRVSSISHFEDAVARYAARHHVSGIVCGHIHTPSIRLVGGVQYFNCGDWVESCTALVEHPDGRMELIEWKTQGARLAAGAAAAAVGSTEEAREMAEADL